MKVSTRHPKFPVLKAFENGGFDIVEDNGWKQITGDSNHPALIALFTSKEQNAELTIICTCLEDGEWVRMAFARPLLEVDEIKVPLKIEGNEEIEAALDRAVSLGFLCLWQAT